MSNQPLIAGETALVPIKNIKLHPDWPYRKDLGFIKGLEKSMSGKNGQLQAIGIDTGGFLIWGLRRFTAAKNLGWIEILCRIFDVDDPLVAMKEENENRLTPTPSEMTAIMRCIEAIERTKAKARQEEGVQEIFPEGGVGQARDKAAATFGLSGKTFEAMKTVEEHGTETLKAAWNAGEISTHDAASAATAPASIQNEAVKRVRKKKVKTARAAVQEIKGEVEPEEIVDDDGFSVPGGLRHVFAEVPQFRSIESSMRTLATNLQKAEETDAYKIADRGLTDQFRCSSANFTGAKKFRDIRPSLVHQACKGIGCEQCGGKGYFTAQEKDEVK